MKRFFKLTAIIFAVIFLITSITACGNSSPTRSADTSSAKIPVVNVVNMPYPDALQSLQDAGFTNITSNVDPSEDVTQWVVINQSVASGKTIRSNDLINLSCAKKCVLYIDVHSEGNLLFSTYDIVISLDGKELGSVPNGKNFTYLADILSGEHTLVFCKSGSTSPKATRKINVTGDMTFACDLSHSGSSIDIKNEKTENTVEGSSLEIVDVTGKVLSEAKVILRDIGFSNVREEPYSNIWDADNWIVKTQGIAPGTVVDKNELIQLDCISLDDYFSDLYVGKNINEIQELAASSGFALRFVDDSSTNLSDQIEAMDPETKNDWVVIKARQYSSADKTALVTISYDGTVVPTPTPTLESTPEPIPSPTSSPAVQAYSDAEVEKTLTSVLGTAFNSSEYKIQIDDTMLNISFYPEGCTVLAYQASVLGDKDAISKWNTVVEAGRGWSRTINNEVHETMNREDLTVALYYCDDTGSGNVFLCIMNGVVYYDLVNGIDLLGLG